MKKITIIIIAFLFFTEINAQVGVETMQPDTLAILDMGANEKGFLMPRMTTAERNSLKVSCGGNCPESMIVFDTDKNTFFYFYAETDNWYCLNAWVAADNNQSSPENIYTNSMVKNVGIQTNADNTYKLKVEGGKVEATDDVIIANNADIGANLNIAGDTELQNVSADGSISVTDSITAENYSTTSTTGLNAPAIKGTIIMWSGSVNDIPTGWAICDGTNLTPNLSNRMIIAGDTAITANYRSSYAAAEFLNEGGETEPGAVLWADGTGIPHMHEIAEIKEADDSFEFQFYAWDEGGTMTYKMIEHGSQDCYDDDGAGKTDDDYMYSPVDGAKTFYTKPGELQKADFNSGQTGGGHTHNERTNNEILRISIYYENIILLLNS